MVIDEKKATLDNNDLSDVSGKAVYPLYFSAKLNDFKLFSFFQPIFYIIIYNLIIKHYTVWFYK